MLCLNAELDRGHFPQTAVDYNILSNMPFQEHHWAKPEPRVSQFGCGGVQTQEAQVAWCFEAR